MLEGVGDQLAGGEHAQVAQLDREAPGGQHPGGEGAGARGGLDAAEEIERRVVEQLRVRPRAGGVLDDQDRHVVVVLRGHSEGADQPVADDLRGPPGPGQGAGQGGDALVDVLAAPLDQAVRVEDGGGAGRERDGAGGVHPAAGAERGPGGVGGAVDGAVLVGDEDREVPGGGVDELFLVGVVDGVDAGRDLAGVDLGGEDVQQLDHLVRREVEPGVGADGGAELAHHGGGPDPAAHHVADDERGAARAEGDDVVPVAADRRVGAAGLVGGGDPEVVGLFQLLREQGALEGDGRLAVAALAGAQAFGGLGVVGDVGGVDEDAFASRLAGDGGAGHRVRAASGGPAGLDRAGGAAAQDLVEEGEDAELGELRHGRGGGGAGRAGAERGRVGVVDVGDLVVGAVQQGDRGGEPADDLAGGQVVEGGAGGGLGGGGVARRRGGVTGWAVRPGGFGSGGRHGTAVVPCGGGSALRSGKAGAPTREVHGISGLVCRSGPLGRAASSAVVIGASGPYPREGAAGPLRARGASLLVTVGYCRPGHSVQVWAHLWSHVQCDRPY